MNEELSPLGKRVIHPAGAGIYETCERAYSFYLVEEGDVKLSVLDPTGRSFTLAILGSGKLFGEEALMPEEHRQTTAVALRETHLIEISADRFRALAGKRPELWPELVTHLIARIRLLEERLSDLAFRGVEERLARLLLDLAERFGEAAPEGLRIELRLTHKELAELVASTRERVSFLLSRFEEAGLLEKRRFQLTIKDVEGLKAKLGEAQPD